MQAEEAEEPEVNFEPVIQLREEWEQEVRLRIRRKQAWLIIRFSGNNLEPPQEYFCIRVPDFQTVMGLIVAIILLVFLVMMWLEIRDIWFAAEAS